MPIHNCVRCCKAVLGCSPAKKTKESRYPRMAKRRCGSDSGQLVAADRLSVESKGALQIQLLEPAGLEGDSPNGKPNPHARQESRPTNDKSHFTVTSRVVIYALNPTIAQQSRSPPIIHDVKQDQQIDKPKPKNNELFQACATGCHRSRRAILQP